MGWSLRLVTDVDGEINCEDIDVEDQGNHAKDDEVGHVDDQGGQDGQDDQDGQVGDVNVDDQGDWAERGRRPQAG